MYDVIIIGAGPAGVSAALYLKRANINPLVVTTNNSSLLKAELIDNYYGLPTATEGKELYNNGINQLEKLGIDIKYSEVLSIGYDGEYQITTKDGSYSCKGVIIACGSSRKMANISNINDYEGKGVSYCAVCDGFFYRKKEVGVLGNGEYALSEANELVNLASKVTIFTNGDELKFAKDDRFDYVEEKIAKLNGEDHLTSITLANNDEVKVDGLFIALGVAGGFDFAKKLGALTNGNYLQVNTAMETNIPGLYSCGDVNGGLLQVSKAVYEGAMAATSMIKWIRAQKKNN